MQKVLDRTLDDGSPVHSFQTSPCQPFLTTKSAAPDGASRLLRIPSRHALTRLNADDFGHSIKLPMNTPAQATAPLGVSNAVTVIREFLAFKPGIAEYGINIQRVQKIRSCEEPACMANTPHVIINSANLLSVQRSKPPSFFFRIFADALKPFWRLLALFFQALPPSPSAQRARQKIRATQAHGSPLRPESHPLAQLLCPGSVPRVLAHAGLTSPACAESPLKPSENHT